MKLYSCRLLIFIGASVFGCSAPPDSYHTVQTKVFIEDAQFERDEALRLEEEIRRNNESLRQINATIKESEKH